MVKLWQNPDTTASFAEQTISLDLSNYDAVYVFCYQATTQQYCRAQGLALKGIQTTIRHITNSSTNIVGMSRNVTMSDTGVAFGTGGRLVQGTSGITTDNSLQIPVYIYGVKF